jgi:hypothetical protein
MRVTQRRFRYLLSGFPFSAIAVQARVWIYQARFPVFGLSHSEYVKISSPWSSEKDVVGRMRKGKSER